MFGKPKLGETDEDILKLQEEFYKQKAENQIKPSVKYVGTSGIEQIRPVASDITSITDTSSKNNGNEDVLPERFLVGKIVERKHDYDKDIDDSVRFKRGFPEVARRKETQPSSSGSLFSQQCKRFRPKQPQPEPMEMDIKPQTISEFTKTKTLQQKINFPSKSFILKGTEKDDIHNENISKMETMTEEEIMEEQKKLMDSLDPEIVKFFKSKRKADEMETLTEDVEYKEDAIDVYEIETTKEILKNSEKWLNFDIVETEKLQWMRNMEITKKLPKADENYEARFDFQGFLLPFSHSEIDENNRSLYHHGYESNRPGYSLQELFKLCRSNVQQQRIIALNTISNILEINSTGIYEDIIEIPIEQIFFIIRISIDDNTPAVLNASIKSLHHIFHSKIDEICLDSLLGFGNGFVQPLQAVEEQNEDDVNEINDQKLSEMNLIKCLTRTDILLRIRYIINTIRPKTETITYCLELLIRLLRDSQTVFNHIIETDLILTIIRNFIPKIHTYKPSESGYDSPQLNAVKLIRVIASRDKVVASVLVEKYGVFESVLSYISNDVGTSTDGVRLQTEAMNLLAVYLGYKMKIECYQEALPFLLRNLEYHFNNTNINEKPSYTKQSHFSAIINVIGKAADINIKLTEMFIPILRNCCTKYCRQVGILNEFKCGALQIISSLLTFLSKYAHNFEEDVLEMLNSKGFDRITKNITSCSNLLCGYDSLKSSSNLKFLEAVVWKTSEHVVPVLLSTSCLPFLQALSIFVEKSSKKIKTTFIDHPNVLNYLKSLKNASKYSLTSNWFTKLETKLVINVLKSAVDVRTSLQDQTFFYELSVKCIALFGHELRNDVDFILKNVVFNRNFYPNEMLINEMNIKPTQNVLEHLQEIYETYSRFMGLKTLQKPLESVSFDIGIGNIVPIDWMYSPILLIYSQREEEKQNEDEHNKSTVLTRCLQWIFLYETYFPILSSLINTTDRFCRLCCVFLASNSLFLEEDIQKLLKNTLDLLLMQENSKELNFDGEIQGLNNFQDFYTELLEHYQGVSYGNKLFANFVLIPLAQKHNVKWRKILWSEYEGVAQIMNITEDECVLNINEFLSPVEEDISVINCYKRSLRSGHLDRSRLLKKIATYHVENYFKNKELKQ